MAEDFSLIEERPASMISSATKEPYERIARFLKPTAETIEEAAPVPFRHLLTEPMSQKLLKSPSKFLFKGWRLPQSKWKQWVTLMLPKHASTWKKSGILYSIEASAVEIRRDPGTISGLVESWCEDTSTFVFEWGEATITLHDLLVLGGFSAVGEPVNAPLKGEMEEIEKRMVRERKGFNKTTSKKASHGIWISRYMGSGDEEELEHVAFLSLWVSRFVFPSHPYDTVGKYVFSIAVRLARGIRIALGPAVLASLYRDLCLMKRSMDDDEASTSVVWAPLQLLQTWAGMRFPPLFSKSQNNKLSFVRKVLKSQKDFQWRPYKEMGVCLDGVEEEEEKLRQYSLARYLRASQLVGLNCKEVYRPHRVAMQFGFDQDVPGHVYLRNCKKTDEEEIRINVPADGVLKCEVSLKYLEWWKRLVVNKRAVIEEILKQLMSSEEGDERGENEIDVVPPGFAGYSPMVNKKRSLEEAWDDDHLTLSQRLKLKKQRIRRSNPILPVKNNEGERSSSMRQDTRARSVETKIEENGETSYISVDEEETPPLESICIASDVEEMTKVENKREENGKTSFILVDEEENICLDSDVEEMEEDIFF